MAATASTLEGTGTVSPEEALMEGFMGEETVDETIHHEYSVRDRCQQIGISFDRVRYRIGIDRFKWLALVAMLKLKSEQSMFDEVMIDGFYQFVVPKLPNVAHLNPLACVLVYYATILYDPLSASIQFRVDHAKLNYIITEIFLKEAFMFQEHGLKPEDLVRYVRRFQLTFSP